MKVKCDNCNKKFTTKASMQRHVKKSCKNKGYYITLADKQQIYEQLLKLQKENEVLKNKVNKMEKTPKITNNINNGNINNGTVNNFTLYAHGKEDLDRIDSNDILMGIKNGFNSTTKLIELINFNPKYPEYHNVYISNVKSKYAMKYDGTEWTLVRKNDLIDDVYEQKRDYIYINMDNYSKSLSKIQRESIDRWMLLDDINPDDPVIKRIKSDIELMLYNKKNIPITTTEKMIGSIDNKSDQLLEQSESETKSDTKSENDINKVNIDLPTKTVKVTKIQKNKKDRLTVMCENKKLTKKFKRPRTKAKNNTRKTLKVSKNK
jgi:hypothetical protein